ncbi:MAG: PIN domain-containing protein [Acidobacteria bacterium]|nr:PIN domain-containing protein [Acidobacteriota bacterium]
MNRASAVLLDVNVLLALMDPGHVHHEPAHQWWARRARRPWATCPLTENGLTRVLTQPRYPNRVDSVAEAVGLLSGWKQRHASTHRWWPADVSLTDRTLFAVEKIVGPGQLADAYLLALALRNGGRVASFDRALPWEALVGGSPDLVELLG